MDWLDYLLAGLILLSAVSVVGGISHLLYQCVTELAESRRSAAHPVNLPSTGCAATEHWLQDIDWSFPQIKKEPVVAGSR